MLFQRGPFTKYTGGFDDDISAEVCPVDLGRIAIFGHLHLLVVNVQSIFSGLDLLFKNTHHRVVFEEVGQLFVFKKVIDADNIDIVALTP